MKKTLLIAAAAVAAGSAWAAPDFAKADPSAFGMGLNAPVHAQSMAKAATRAGDSFEFSYSDELYSATYLTGTSPGTSRVYLGFLLDSEDIKGLAGDKVTGFTVFSPTNQSMTGNSIKEGRFFYSKDLQKEDYSQVFEFSTEPFAENKISLDTPYTITGEENGLFFGYSLVVPTANDMYYIPFDGISNPYTGAGVFSVSNDDSFPTEFYSFVSDLGALCMSITIEGDNFPGYVSFASVPSEIYVELGKESSTSVVLSATSADPIKTIDFEYSIGGQDYSVRSTLAEPVAGAGRIFNASIPLPALKGKIKENVTFTITKYNDKVNTGNWASVTIPVAVLSEVPKRQTLYEEYTSTNCGFCPRGFAALEYIRTNYPEFVTASFHSMFNGKADPMQVTSSFPSEVTGFPSVFLNRSVTGDPYYGTEQYGNLPVPVIGDILEQNSIATPWKISVSHEWANDSTLVAKAQVANMAGFDKGAYKIAYLLVADGLKGTTSSWIQANYFYSYKQEYIEELNQFCKGGAFGKSRVTGLEFNDVVISPLGIHGVAGSIPASLEPEQAAEHSLTFDLSKISSILIPDKNKLRVIAAVVDANGNVMNCAKDEVNDFKDFGTSGVSDVCDENAPVEFYNLNGMKVANPTEGVYIRRQGSKTEKIVIR